MSGLFSTILGAVQAGRASRQPERPKATTGLVDDVEKGAMAEMMPPGGHEQARAATAAAFNPAPAMVAQQGAEQQAHQAAANQMGSMFAAPSLETADYNAMMAQRRRGY